MPITSRQEIIFDKVDGSLTVSLGGDNFVDANLLAETIKDVVKLVEYSQQEISPNTNVELKIKAFQPGSFEIALVAIFDFISSDKMGNIASFASLILTAVPAVFSFAKFLSGRNAKKIKKNDTEKTVAIQNYKGEHLTISQNVYNIYALPECNLIIADIFERLEEDDSITNIKIETKDEKEIIEAKDFRHLAKTTTLEPLRETVSTSMINKVKVIVRKPDLAGNSQWGLYFNKQINANMEDESFIERVHNGSYQFGSKDSLIVDLRIERMFDDEWQTVVKTEKYFVQKVHLHIPYRDEISERQLDFNDCLNEEHWE